MVAYLIFGLVILSQPSTTLPVTSVPTAKAPEVAQQKTSAPCDARPFQQLVGRTVSDLLTARLPPRTRIYRLDDPITEAIQPGRLSVEINRSTRVRRVYCS